MSRLGLPAAAFLAAAALPAAAVPAASQTRPSYGPELEGFEYPFPVDRHAFDSQRQALQMAFVDVKAPQPNGRTVVLLHGKNFCAATWEHTIRSLGAAGYRVIAPDQVGFCKSSKPAGYQFSFGQLATNTHALLASLGVARPILVGHSMGGMLAARYALMFPDAVERLVMVDPLGLEDWQAEGVPFQSLDEAFASERQTSFERIKAYQLKFYYNGRWTPEYDRWAEMGAGLFTGPGRDRVAWNSAQTSEMIQTEPVVHELDRLRVPTTLIVGAKDRTAPGANRAPPEIAERLGRYDRLGPAAAARIPGARLVVYPEAGHAPQVEMPDQFDADLLAAIAAP